MHVFPVFFIHHHHPTLLFSPLPHRRFVVRSCYLQRCGNSLNHLPTNRIFTHTHIHTQCIPPGRCVIQTRLLKVERSVSCQTLFSTVDTAFFFRSYSIFPDPISSICFKIGVISRCLRYSHTGNAQNDYSDLSVSSGNDKIVCHSMCWHDDSPDFTVAFGGKVKPCRIR